MAKIIEVYKHKFGNLKFPTDEKVEWILRSDGRAIPHQITVDTEVLTIAGPMLKVKLKQQTEFSNPDVDVAMLVGHVKAFRKAGIRHPHPPELWFYNDKYWVKARNADSADYYSNHWFLFYEVNVDDLDGLLRSVSA